MSPTDEKYRYLPNRARYWRDRRGFSRAKLAKMLNTSERQIVRLENGEREMTVNWMNRIATALRVPASALLNETDPDTLTGFSDQDVVPYGDVEKSARNNSDWWEVQSRALALAGILPGDRVLIDLSTAPKEGDIVVAQNLRAPRGEAETVLRIFKPPYLVAQNSGEPLSPLMLDGHSVSVMGVMVELKRGRRSDR